MVAGRERLDQRRRISLFGFARQLEPLERGAQVNLGPIDGEALDWRRIEEHAIDVTIERREEIHFERSQAIEFGFDPFVGCEQASCEALDRHVEVVAEFGLALAHSWKCAPDDGRNERRRRKRTVKLRASSVATKLSPIQAARSSN